MCIRLNGLRYLWFILLVATIFIFSGADEVSAPDPGFQYDKLAHFLVFGLIATALFRAFEFPFNNRSCWIRIFWVTVVVSAIGGLDEMRQYFADGRTAEIADWLADTLGAFVASIVYAFWPFYRRLLEFPLKFRRRRGILL
jgi:VanZ family protein